LQAAGNNRRKLGNLRKSLARIRVFDPACGSGNFLVIAYKELRGIEAEINARLGEAGRRSTIPLTNFRGIELNSFPAEIARLALIIAEYQCDVAHRGQAEALAEFLPLDARNWITCGNALRLDWRSVCPPAGTGVDQRAEDLFHTPQQAGRAFANEGGTTFICGNPPYRGSQWKSKEQKEDLKAVFDGRVKNWKSLDYVSGWFMKAADYARATPADCAFVATNSICQGRQVPVLWPALFATGARIAFAHNSFKWANLAKYNAGVSVVIVGLSRRPATPRRLFTLADGGTTRRTCTHINAYLIAAPDVIVTPRPKPLADVADMQFGNMPNDGGHLLLSFSQADAAINAHDVPSKFIKPIVGSKEFIRGEERRCIWVADSEYAEAKENAWLCARFEAVRRHRLSSRSETTRQLANTPHRFGEVRQRGDEQTIVIPGVSSEHREYFPVGLVPPGAIISNSNFALYDAPLWNLAILASRLHLVWVGAVCSRLETRFRYSNTLGWNTFPLPPLTQNDKARLAECAKDILLAREACFPATIADLYAPGATPEPLCRAHARNDEVVERIQAGRRFRNDTDRLEWLFEAYVKGQTGVA